MAGALGLGARAAGAGGAGAGALGGAANGLRGVTGATNSLIGSLKGLLTAVPDATKALTQLGQELAQYVRFANPVAVQRLTLATEDLMAMMGRGLTPVLELVTKTIRLVADSMEPFIRVMHSFARALDPVQKVVGVVVGILGRMGQQFAGFVEKLEPSLVLLGDAVLEMYKATAPLVNLVVDLTGALFKFGSEVGTTVFETLLPPVIAITRAFGDLAQWITDALKAILALFGVKLDERPGTAPNSSVGAAVRPAQVGSVEGALQKALTSAFSLGAGGRPEERTASATEGLREAAGRMHTEIQGLVTKIENLPANVAAAFVEFPGKVGEAVGAALKTAKEAVTALPGKAVDEGRDLIQRGRAAAAGAVDEAKGRVDRFTGGNFGFKLFD